MENGKEQRDLINLLVEGNEADGEVDLKTKKYLRCENDDIDADDEVRRDATDSDSDDDDDAKPG